MLRGRRTLTLDLKRPDAVRIVRALSRDADGVIEGFRPGVVERLGLGPAVLAADNRRLVYGRMTGWGQHGPLSQAAGHDLAFLAISGALHAMGRDGEKPPVPLNLVGDYGGGAMLLAFGMVSAMLSAQRTGIGDVVDAAISDGSALLMAMFHATGGRVDWQAGRGAHMLSGAAPYYDTYRTADGGFVAVAAVEPQFWTLLLHKLGLGDDPVLTRQEDRALWPEAKRRLAALFESRDRAHWCALLEGTDACFAPVLSMREAWAHPHNRARRTFLQRDGITEPAPAPRFASEDERTPGAVPEAADDPDLLRDAGFDDEEVGRMRRDGVFG